MADQRINLRIFLLFAVIVEVCFSFEWTGSLGQSYDSSIPACLGQDVTLSWDYTLGQGETVLNLEWRYRRSNATPDEVLATAVNGEFFADVAAAQRVQFIPGAGIRLLGVTAASSGIYTVLANLQQAGAIHTYGHAVTVVVTDQTITATAQLEAHFAGARYIAASQQHHLILTCGVFTPLWMPASDVVWTTPDGHTLPSTSRDNGYFTLALPNPFLSGEYSCGIDAGSPVTLCIGEESPLKHSATVAVDATEGRLALMDSEIKLVQQQMQQMSGQLQGLSSDAAGLWQQVGHALQDLNPNSFNLTGTLPPVTAAPIRLAGGSHARTGRVEIFLNGTWGTVCDDLFSAMAARVVCRQLGYLSSNPTVIGAAGGEGPIHLDDVECAGDETSLLNCPHLPIGTNNCGHGEDVGVTCNA